MLHLLRALMPNQRSAVLVSYLGWTVDTFDFFSHARIVIVRCSLKHFGHSQSGTYSKRTCSRWARTAPASL